MLACFGVPQSYRPVKTPTRKRTAVQIECQDTDFVCVPGKLMQLLAGIGIPKIDRAIHISASNEASIVADRNASK